MSTDWAAYDAPALRDSVTHLRSGGRREMLVRVHGLHCAACVSRLEWALAPLCENARVSLSTGTAELRWDGAKVALSQLFRVIESTGYRPEPIAERSDLRAGQQERRGLLLRIGAAGVLGMQVMMLAATRYADPGTIAPALELVMRYAQWAMATPVLLYSGWPFLRGAARSLAAGRTSMDVPIALALLLAYVASCINVLMQRGHVYFDSVTMFVFLLLLARWFEGSGRAEATRRLRELSEAQPLSALRERSDSAVEEVASSELRAGDVLLVPPASAVAADGVLLSAAAELDESLLTGEQLPAVKARDARVYAGSVNAGNTPLRVEVAATGTATMLSYINHLVHRAQSQRPRVQQLADRIAAGVTVAVLLCAALGALWWWPRNPETAFEVALAVLVVTCPCALSLATPAALAAAASALTRRGVLLTRADALLELPRIDTVCFDKTGTLTTGRMQCVRVEPRRLDDSARCLELAAALERGIHHPVATAFAAQPNSLHAEAVATLPGRGVRGRIAGRDYQLLGSVGDDGLTWLALSEDGVEIARFGLRHQLRAEAREVVAALQAQGLQVLMLSGDGADAVAGVARTLGIADYRARLKPEDKLQVLQQLRAAGHRVWMIGDGVNDAPTLAAADVSTSLASGSALAQAQAGLLLTGDGLAALPEALALARRTRVVIAQNLVWATLYNLAAVPLALSGGLTPWIAALGMGASSVTVVVNALRLARAPRVQPQALATGVLA